MHPLDWFFLLLPSVAVVYIAIRTHYYHKGVAGFLAGGRVGGRYLLAVASGEAGMGLITVVAIWERYYQSGFAIGFWSSLTAPIGLIMTLTGFLIYRYRETRVMTMAQFFEVRYSKRFRVFAGMLAFASGLINYAIFPAVGARFLIYFGGLPLEVNLAGFAVSTYPLVMGGFLSLALAMALIGRNRHYHFDAIRRRHFNSTARKMGYGQSAEPLLRELVERTPAVVDEVAATLPAGFSQVVADKVLGGLLAAARALERGDAA